MEIVIAEEVQARDSRPIPAGGSLVQNLLDGDAPDGLNFLFRRASRHVPGGDETERHRQTYQQIRFAERGSANFAPGQDIPEGDIAYFPRGADYGPQTREPAMIIVALQYGFFGEHQKGEIWEALRAQAIENLRARGALENGVFIYVDPATGETRRSGSAEAISEEQYQLRYGRDKQLVIPPKRYDSPVLMHREAFAYYASAPGVELKQLGRFFDQPGVNGDTRILMARIREGGVHCFSAERAQLAWSLSPGVQIDSRVYPRMTCVYSPLGEEGELCSADSVEVYIVEFPRVD
jgi:hypothetical protein